MKPLCLILFFNLMACSATHQFDCPYKEGARCLSVGEIDAKINADELRHNTGIQSKDTNAQKLDIPFNNHVVPTSLRTPETVLMAWIAPYYTTDGVYHEGERIHFVASSPTWINMISEVSMSEASMNMILGEKP